MSAPAAKKQKTTIDAEIYGLTSTTLEGNEFAMSQLKGKVGLIVNVASH
jgi:glutathione peroxidase-family protein